LELLHRRDLEPEDPGLEDREQAVFSVASNKRRPPAASNTLALGSCFGINLSRFWTST